MYNSLRTFTEIRGPESDTAVAEAAAEEVTWQWWRHIRRRQRQYKTLESAEGNQLRIRNRNY